MLRVSDFEARYRGHIPAPQDIPGRYAVLVPLVERAGEPHLLFEVRADTMRRQPGEVCFPGGRVEVGETAEQCVLRETEEELAIPPAAVELIAPLDYLVHQGKFMMQPILGRVDPAAAAALKPGPDEVKETFLVPVEFFREHPPMEYTYDMVPEVPEDFPYELIGFPQGYRWRRGRGDVPIYRWEGHAIWGLTGRIVRHLMQGMECL